MNIEEIIELAEANGWEVHTDTNGTLIIDTGVEDPAFNRDHFNEMRQAEAKDAQEKRDMLDR